MFSYIEAGIIYTFDNAEDAMSDLSKALYGTRSMIGDAAWLLDAWLASHPSQVPVVYDGMLWTGSQFEAEMEAQEAEREAERQAKIDARRAERQKWHNASPMREALREAGLI